MVLTSDSEVEDRSSECPCRYGTDWDKSRAHQGEVKVSTTGAPIGCWWRFKQYEIGDGYIPPRWSTRWKSRPVGKVLETLSSRLAPSLPGTRQSCAKHRGAGERRSGAWGCAREAAPRLGLLPHATSVAVMEWRTPEPGRTYFVRNADGLSWTELDRAMYEHKPRPHIAKAILPIEVVEGSNGWISRCMLRRAQKQAREDSNRHYYGGHLDKGRSMRGVRS